MAWVIKEGMPHLRLARRLWARVEIDPACGFAYLKTISESGEKFILEVLYDDKTYRTSDVGPTEGIPDLRMKTPDAVTLEEAVERCKRYAEDIFETNAF